MHPHQNLAIERAIARNKNFTLEEIEKSQTLKEVGHSFVKEYKGDARFIHGIKHLRSLTAKQLRVALEIMVEEEKRYQASQVKCDPIYDGRFTVVFGEYEYTIRIAKYEGTRYKVPEGTQSALLLIGPDNTRDYLPVAFIYPNRQLVMGAKHRSNGPLTNAIKKLLDDDDPIKYGEAYALKTRCCWRCHRDLTNSKSIIRGLGPWCAKQLGIYVEPPKSKKIEKRPNKSCEACLGTGETPDDDLAVELGIKDAFYMPCYNCMPNAYEAELEKLTASKPAERVGDEVFDE